MSYRLKPIEVEALQIPGGFSLIVQNNVESSQAEVTPGQWLVAVEGRLAVFSDEHFKARVEVMPGHSRARTLKRSDSIALPDTAPDGDRAGADEARVTVAEMLVAALAEKARTVGELAECCRRKGHPLKRPTVSATLNVLKRQKRVENNGCGEWKLSHTA